MDEDIRGAKASSCPLCSELDDEEMVQCDTCDKWYHFRCVGVSEEVSSQDWDCEACKQTAGEGENMNVAQITYITPVPSKEKVIESNNVNKQVSEEKVIGSGKRCGSMKDREIDLMQLEEERRVNLLFIQRKYELMRLSSSQNEEENEAEVNKATAPGGQRRENLTSSFDPHSLVTFPQRGTQRENTSQPLNFSNNVKDASQSGMQGDHQLPSLMIFSQRGTQRENTAQSLNFSNNAQDASQSGMQGDHQLPSFNQNVVDRHFNALSTQQLHARQVLSPDLPTFSGTPEEWPCFISNFENSTRICGFSNEENLLRLQRALKGKAYQYVGSRLVLPSLVPEVMSTLRLVFGRPEHIIDTLLAKIRQSPAVNGNQLEPLVHFALEVKNITATMEASGLYDHMRNPMLLSELVQKLPAPIRLNWASYARLQPRSNLQTFSAWIYRIAEDASTVIKGSSLSPAQTDQEKRKTQRLNVHHYNDDQTAEQVNCQVCDKTHIVSECEKFKHLDYDEKWNAVRKHKLCRTCLKQHNLAYCPDRKECGVNGCTAKHHMLLHNQKRREAVAKSNSAANDNNAGTDESPFIAIQLQRSSTVLYKIVPVTVFGINKSVKTYAFLDDGSGVTLIDKAIVDLLQVQGERSDLLLRWTDGSIQQENDSFKISLTIAPQGNETKRFLLRDVRTVSTLDLPKQTLIYKNLAEEFKHLRGLPVETYKNIVPKMIIGLNNIRLAMPLKFREGKTNEPAAAKTRLGWTIFGSLAANDQDSHSEHEKFQFHICECDDDIALQKLISENMKLEQELKKEQVETICQDVKSIIKRDGNRFEANLLWKANNILLPNNLHMATRRLSMFERKLMNDETLRDQVNQRMLEMEQKGYIRRLSAPEINVKSDRTWYLPIFAVTNPNKPNKIRIVWDAAAEYNGLSLNKCLDKGPDLLTPLIKVLFNFRVGKIGLCADICEMYHRIHVNESDQDSQRFLWRNCDCDRPPDHFVLQVLSFGASCSPSIAQMVKNQNAKEFQDEFPRAAKSVLERHYVDDLMDSVDTVEEGIRLAKDVIELHSRANFHIRNWISNSSEVLNAIGEKSSQKEFCHAGQVIDQVIEPEKVLGLWWQVSKDAFTFTLKHTKACQEIMSGEKLPTKRELLRLLMSVFDPLGFLNHYTIHIRILLQLVWRSGTNWDDVILEKLKPNWMKLLSILPNVKEVRIPRCYFEANRKNSSEVELHIFMDASEDAYAAVAYFRVVENNKTEVALIGSKAKVAPLRPMSIPRMELQAALLGARYGQSIVQLHDLKIDSVHYWTDSRTVLQWIQADPRNYKQFVMLRIGEIQEITIIKNWHHVSSKLNVADMATKWSKSPCFYPENVWFRGPDFLRNQDLSSELQTKHNISEDMRLVAAHIVVKTEIIDVARFSRWERLHRSMAFVKRFITSRRNRRILEGPSNPLSMTIPNLSSEELQWSENILYRVAQSKFLAKEIEALNRNQTLPAGSAIKEFSPFIDQHGVIRSKGRIEKTTLLPEPAKNPIILPKAHYVTYLLVKSYHTKFKHANHETVINEIFQRFRISGLRNLLRKIRHECLLCRIRDARPQPPQMGQLPVARMSAFQRPFSFTGLDFFGPFYVTVKRSTCKRYGVLFTCLTCRAIHIEIAFSLNTDSCIMAIRNFIARRGTPIQFFSDNGTNLKSSERTLREACQEIDFNQVQQKFVSPESTWTFIPPASPHMGGAWERLIRSIKTAMYHIITPNTKLTDEKLINLFLEVESIINSRPLSYLSLETAEEEVLTPNHFLLGSSSGMKPPGYFSSRDQLTKQSWRHSQYLADMFWKRWVSEVLPELTRRTKWHQKVKPIKIGDVVFIADPNTLRNQWPKGRVTRVITGSDGQVRSAYVQTPLGEYHRPATKIAVLDVQQIDGGDGDLE